MTAQDLNPLRAFRRAWKDIESELDDIPDESVPDDVRRARESVGAMRELKESLSAVGAERRRLKAKGQ